MRKNYCQQGFSLLEIMVVIVIIGLIVSVVSVGVMGYISKARVTMANTQMKEFIKALDLYKMEKGSYPSTGQGLNALMELKSGGQPLLKEIPKDPWGNSYRYRSSGSSCEVICYGADGREGGSGENEDIKVSTGGN